MKLIDALHVAMHRRVRQFSSFCCSFGHTSVPGLPLLSAAGRTCLAEEPMNSISRMTSSYKVNKRPREGTKLVLHVPPTVCRTEVLKGGCCATEHSESGFAAR